MRIPSMACAALWISAGIADAQLVTEEIQLQSGWNAVWINLGPQPNDWQEILAQQHVQELGGVLGQPVVGLNVAELRRRPAACESYRTIARAAATRAMLAMPRAGCQSPANCPAFTLTD